MFDYLGSYRKTKEWRVEFETRDPLKPDPLMGWVSSVDMKKELQLSFPSLEEALQYVKTKGFQYKIITPAKISLFPKPMERTLLAHGCGERKGN